MMSGGDFSYLNKRYGGGRVAKKTGQKGKDARDVLELEDLLLPGMRDKGDQVSKCLGLRNNRNSWE